MATLATIDTGSHNYDLAFQASLGLYQTDLDQAALNAKLAVAPFFSDKQIEIFGDPNMTSNIALKNHLIRVVAAGRLNNVNVDAVAWQLRQQFLV
jgi:hypothetical protein